MPPISPHKRVRATFRGIWKHTFPREDPSLKNQTELATVDDETYHKAYTANPSTLRDRVIQVVYFIVFFGWLRLVIALIATAVSCLLLTPLYICHRSAAICSYVVPVSEWIAQRYIRILCWCFGIWRISVRGKPDPKTRCFTYNHTCLLDGPLFFMYSMFTIVITAGVIKIPFFGKLFIGARSIFIDRWKVNAGNGKAMSDGILDHSKLPLAVAPEGKISDGSYLFRFRRGAFLTDEQLQPATIRYTEYLTTANISLNSLPASVFDWLWLCLCVPFARCEVTFLDPIPPEKLRGKLPEERADMVQLITANSLGTLASSRTNHEIFGLQRKAE
jgi:1-acyl-sn-glycerol-3-phosphate acyltransferase